LRNFEDDPTLDDLLSDDQRQRLNRALSALCREPVALTANRQDNAEPVEFNLETVGWLSGGESAAERRAASELVSFLLLFVAKYRLAANLHHDTTEASYAELQRQNEALKASEARFRELSDQLQQRVDEQVEVIRQNQQDLYESSRLRSVGHLAAGVAHEINNPIGFISSNLRVARDYLEDLRDIVPDTEQNRELLADFNDLIGESADGARRIAGIVADLKTFSSIDQSGYTLCDLNELITSAIHLLQTEYHHQLQVLEQLGDIPRISGNPGRLAQSLYNLLDNAAQALRDAQKGSDQGHILVRTVRRDNQVDVLIQDNGCGISEANLGLIFDAFYTTRPVGSGTGLGLTVARDTARAHGGTLQIDSREGQGTRVTLTFTAP